METYFCFIFLIALAYICTISANMDMDAVKARLNIRITKLFKNHAKSEE